MRDRSKNELKGKLVATFKTKRETQKKTDNSIKSAQPFSYPIGVT